MTGKRKWYSLIDKVWRMDNLEAAWRAVKANQGAAGVDGQTIDDFVAGKEEELQRLQEELRTKTYIPQPVRRKMIPKPQGGQRPLGIPAIRDRVVQQALRQVLEPIFEPEFLDCSFGFRPGRSAHDALNRITEYLQGGYVWVVDADIKSYFDTIPHEKLIDKVAEKVSDGSILKLIRSILKAGVIEDGIWEESEVGSPQGGVISPLLANLYLHSFDKLMTERGHKLVRYADDWIALCRSKKAAERVMNQAKAYLEGELELTVHPEKSRVVGAMWPEPGFDFLSYHFWVKETMNWTDGTKTWTPQRRPSEKAIQKFKDRIRQITRRNQTVGAEVIIGELNKYLPGWVQYFGRGAVKTRFAQWDSWMRRRIRMVQMRSWKQPKPLHKILRRKGWSKEKLLHISIRRWRNSKSPMIHAALDNVWFNQLGWKSMSILYANLMHPIRA